jgi:polysaccharide biosynthesis protein VpsM
MRLSGKIAILALSLLFLAAAPAAAQKEKAKEVSEPEGPVEVKPQPPERPVEPPGHFPGLIPPSTIGTIEEGPVSGLIAPYGNSAAYDNLLRGWQSHKIGRATVTPYFELDGIYRSNIYSTPADKKGDFITSIAPGIRAEVPIGQRHLLSLGYLGAAFIYSHYGNQSHYDQNINADLALNPQGRLSFRLGNTLRLATEERNSEFSTNRQYLRNTPYLTAIYKFADRWKLEGNYQLDTLEFARSVDRFNNCNQQTMGATLYYRFWPKTALLAQYIFVYRAYPSFSQDNTTSHSPLVGLTWDPTAKLSGNIKFGYTFANYETSLVDRNNSPDSWTLSAQLLYRFSRYTNVSVLAQRSFQQDFDFFNAGYNNSAVWVTLNHEWSKFKVASFASFFYMNNAYINATEDVSGQIQTRNDNIVGVGVGLSRQLTRRLRLRAAYSYINRSSNFPGYGYNDNKVLVGLQGSF